jgi:hypothetical protein
MKCDINSNGVCTSRSEQKERHEQGNKRHERHRLQMLRISGTIGMNVKKLNIVVRKREDERMKNNGCYIEEMKCVL